MPIISVPIAVSTDDASFDTGTGNIYATDLTRIFVNGPGSGGRTGVTRFLPAIPAGATVVTATLTLFPAGDHNDIGDDIVLRAVAADDYASPAFADSSRARTTAGVAWAPGPALNVGGGRGDAMVSPNLAAVLQEIVDRPGWASGQGIGLMLDAPTATETGNTAYKFRTHDWNPTYAPILDVEYTEGAGGGDAELTVDAASSTPAAPGVTAVQAHALAVQASTTAPHAPGVTAGQAHTLLVAPATAAPHAPSVGLASGAALEVQATTTSPTAPSITVTQDHQLATAAATVPPTAPAVTLATGTILTTPPATTAPVAPSIATSQAHLLSVAPATGPPVAPKVTLPGEHALTTDTGTAHPVAPSISLSKLGTVTNPAAWDASTPRDARDASTARTVRVASIPRAVADASTIRSARDAGPTRSARSA